MRMLYHVMSAPAPLGLLFMAASEKGLGLQVVEYMDRRSLKRTLSDHTTSETTFEASLHGLRPLADQMDEYFTGARQTFEWPLAPVVNDALQLAVLRAIRRVPFGTTCKVSELARQIGQPRQTKDVQQAVLHNPLAIVIPCHRIVGTDGKTLDGVGGAARRRALLEIEQRFAQMGRLDDNRVIGELVRRTAAGARMTAQPRTTTSVATATATAKKPASKVAARGRSESGGTATLTARPKTRAAAARSSARTATPVKAAAKKRSR